MFLRNQFPYFFLLDVINNVNSSKVLRKLAFYHNMTRLSRFCEDASFGSAGTPRHLEM